VAISFVVFGVFWGSWAVAAADVERALRLSHGGFGLLLSVALAGAAAANAVMASLAERWGTARAMSWSLAFWAAVLAMAAASGRGAPLGAALVGMVTAGGAVDVVMNIAATAALADRPGRLVRFHALFNGGAAAGALATGFVLRTGVSWRAVWAVVAVAAAGLALLHRKATLPAGEAGERQSLLHALRIVRTEGLVLLAVAFAVGAMVEAGIETWGVLFLRERLASGVLLGAGAAVAGYVIASAARVTLGPLAGAAGAPVAVGAGAALSAVGLAVLALSPSPGVAAAGLVAAAGGVSMCWPLLLAQAGMGRERPAAAVGGVSAIGYLGFVVGPAAVGSVAQLAGLRAGLLALAAAAVFVAVAPARVEARRAQARGHAVSPRESPLPRPAPPPSPPRP
jgi:hypothetical protein